MSSTIQLDEVCKVLNAAVQRRGRGYSFAVIKKVNKTTARIDTLDASYNSDKSFTVKLDTLWKIKSNQRKALQSKVAKAAAPPVVHALPPPPPPSLPPPPLYTGVEHINTSSMSYPMENNLKVVAKIKLGSGGTLGVAHDSVVNFTGDAIVNAANEGCLGGGGIDGRINDLGGDALFYARKALPLLDDTPWKRCNEGDAKITIAGKLPCKHVIHAVGPRFGFGPDFDSHLAVLEKAYENTMTRARENDIKSIGFCILSAGIFRGNCPLKTVVKKGMDAIAKNTYPGLQQVVFCGFTGEEQRVLEEIVAEIESNI